MPGRAEGEHPPLEPDLRLFYRAIAASSNGITIAVQPDEFLRLAAGPEYVRRAYVRTGARFSVDRHGTLTLELDPLQTDGTHTATICGSLTKTV